jgi:hypothetical protein
MKGTRPALLMLLFLYPVSAFGILGGYRFVSNQIPGRSTPPAVARGIPIHANHEPAASRSSPPVDFSPAPGLQQPRGIPWVRTMAVRKEHRLAALTVENQVHSMPWARPTPVREAERGSGRSGEHEYRSTPSVRSPAVRVEPQWDRRSGEHDRRSGDRRGDRRLFWFPDRFDDSWRSRQIHQDNLIFLQDILASVPLPEGEKLDLIYFFQAQFRDDRSFRSAEFVDLISFFVQIAGDPRLSLEQRRQFLRHLIHEEFMGRELYLRDELDADWMSWKNTHGFPNHGFCRGGH